MQLVTKVLIGLKQVFKFNSRKNLNLCQLGSRYINTKSLTFNNFGEPIDVLKLIDGEIKDPAKNEVLIKILLSPINPVDINFIQGRYAIRPKKFPAVPGNEFVAEVLDVGENVRTFSIGELVVPLKPGLGSWRTHMIVKENEIFSVAYTSLVEAATMCINPCTAYRMLKDFAQLRQGDLIIQNAANSGVGQAVHQLCKLWGLKSVGVIRDRPNISCIKEHLIRLGATAVLTYDELKTTNLFKECHPKPKLALNCVGGKMAEDIAKHLDNHGFMVTYGGMSLKPFNVFTGPLIFKSQKYVGFWITNWITVNFGSKLHLRMMEEIREHILDKKFVAPLHELIPFENFANKPNALCLDSSKSNTKFIFDMETVNM